MSNNKLNWSDLTTEQKEEIIKKTSQCYTDIINSMQKDYLEKLKYDLFTPFWVKWWHKIQGGNNDQQ